ncbi:hypothetical protein HY620_01765 [Candidatus Uhrbacteria bacterium]|nr:hypothetical protein [Candidatus Uhrbacteria bacterium]
MNLDQLFTLRYWITTNPGTLSLPTVISFGIFFCLCIAAPFLFTLYYRTQKKVLAKPEKRLMQKLKSMCVTMGGLGLVWLAFAYETLPILSARFWLLILIVCAGIWIYAIYGYATKDMKEQLEQIKQREQLSKYMPRKL